MEEQFFGLISKYIKKMAFHLAIKNGISDPFSVKDNR
jgi:hypothetical protein